MILIYGDEYEFYKVLREKNPKVVSDKEARATNFRSEWAEGQIGFICDNKTAKESIGFVDGVAVKV
jgi:hypothetical protein